jgi:WD40 repeat protein
MKFKSAVMCLDASEDQIVAGLDEGLIELWQHGIYQQTFTGHKSRVESVKFMSHNRIVSTSWNETIRLWSIDQKCQLHIFDNHSDYFNHLATLSDSLFISASSNSSMIWDISTLNFDSIFHCELVNIYKAVFDETCVVYPSKNSVKIWYMNGDEAELKGHEEEVQCVAKNSDVIVSGCYGSLRVRSVRDKSEIASLK